LSYRRAGEATPSSGAATVTVCTNHLALCNLVEDALPAPVPKALANAEAFVAKVIELEHDGIRLPAVDAGMLTQIVNEEFEPLGDDLLLSALRLFDIAAPVGAIVLLLVGRPARAAVVVPLTLLLAPPRKVAERL
jgi:hypothetical protein